MFVDYHAHWNPPEYLEALASRSTPPRAERSDDGWLYTTDDHPVGNQWNWPKKFQDLDAFVADMDAAGVDVSVASPAVLGGEPTSLDRDAGVAALRLLNERFAAGAARHPSRFRALAMLPLQDVDAAIEMLDWAIGDLGMVGVCMSVNLGGASIATPRLLPLYRRIERLGVPIVLHPSFRSTAYQGSIAPSVPGGPGERLIDVGLGWVYDTSLAVLTLICNGIFDACPDLAVLHPHTGGVMPFISTRFDAAMSVPETAREFTLDRTVPEYLRHNVYVDCAAGATAPMLAMAAEVYGADHLLFGSDYPFVDRIAYASLFDDTSSDASEDLAVRIRGNRLPGIDLR